jgi:hypothetical protein
MNITFNKYLTTKGNKISVKFKSNNITVNYFLNKTEPDDWKCMYFERGWFCHTVCGIPNGVIFSVTVTNKDSFQFVLSRNCLVYLRLMWVKRDRENSRQAIDHGCNVRAPERGWGFDWAFARCRFEAGRGGFPLAGPQAEKIIWQFLCLAC